MFTEMLHLGTWYRRSRFFATEDPKKIKNSDWSTRVQNGLDIAFGPETRNPGFGKFNTGIQSRPLAPASLESAF